MKKKKLLFLFLLSISGGYFLFKKKITGNLDSKGENKDCITIVATTTIIADAIRSVAGDLCESNHENQKIKLIQLMGPGVDPHLYRPSQGDLENIFKADIVFFNGKHLEGKMADMFENGIKNGNPFYPVSDGVADEKFIRDHRFEECGVDPHFWFDISIWTLCVEYICKILSLKNPENASVYSKNTQKYIKKLELLDSYVRGQVEKIPKKQRVIISSHDAFGYLGRTYHLEARGLQGISTLSECGLRDVSEMKKLIVSRGIKSIFLETSVPEGPILAIVEGCKNQGYSISIGGHLYSDALGDLGKPEGSYIGMIKYNIDTLVAGLA